MGIKVISLLFVIRLGSHSTDTGRKRPYGNPLKGTFQQQNQKVKQTTPPPIVLVAFIGTVALLKSCKLLAQFLHRASLLKLQTYDKTFPKKTLPFCPCKNLATTLNISQSSEQKKRHSLACKRENEKNCPRQVQ